MALATTSFRAAPSSLAQKSCRAPVRPFCPLQKLHGTARHMGVSPRVEAARSRPAHVCHAFNNDPNKQQPGSSGQVAGGKVEFNNAYAAITLSFLALLVFRNPYIYAVLSVVTILPQNSSVTSLNNLVLFFYDSGLFVNFAEAVTAVRLVTWLSIIMTLVSFALFS